MDSHYGPEFAAYIQEQNAKIDAGTLKGEKINLVALGINNGWIDSELQEKAYIDYSVNNTYKQIITPSEATSYYNSYQRTCLPAVQACEKSGTNSACVNADNKCYNSIEGPLSEEADFNVYDVRISSSVTDPPETYAKYLARSDVVKAIGAKSTYQECPNGPYQKFASTGDSESHPCLCSSQTQRLPHSMIPQVLTALRPPFIPPRAQLGSSVRYLRPHLGRRR